MKAALTGCIVMMLTAVACGDSDGATTLGTRAELEAYESGRPVPHNGSVTVTDLVPTRVRLTNTGDADLQVLDVVLEATPAEAFQLVMSPKPAAGSPLVIAPQDSHDLTLYFDSSKVTGGQPGATVRITTNRTQSGRTEFVFRAAPEASSSHLLAQPSVIDFDVVTAGQSSTETVSLLNTGSATLEVSTVFLSGHPGFSLTVAGVEHATSQETAVSGITLSPPLSIGAGSAVSLEVKYAASGAEKAEGLLTFISNDPSAPDGTLVSLFANVDGPCIRVMPQRVDFGGKLVGQQAVIEMEIESCGDRALEVSSIVMANDGGGVFGVDPSAAGTFPLVIAPDDSVRVPVTFLPTTVATLDGDGQFIRSVGKIVVSSNAYLATYEVEVRGFGTDGSCPTAVITCLEGNEVLPQQEMHCSASASTATAGNITGYQWGIRQPNGSTETIRPSPTQPDILFSANIIGSYTLTLDVWDQFGTKSCSTTEFEFIVTSNEAIHVELLWRTPGDINETDTGSLGNGTSVGSDVDLHVLNPKASGWFDPRWDCNWLNPNPNWGGSGTADDPRLDRDDVDGAGPENFNLDLPEFNATYTVGAHYWDDWGYGIAFATVRVYIYGQLRFNWNDVRLVNFDIWSVCEVDWPGGAVRAIGGNVPQLDTLDPSDVLGP